MAEKTSFLLGVLGADFMQLKTSDNVYLKDIMADISESLDVYNSREAELTRLMAYRFDDASSTAKKIYTDDSFSEIGEIQTPGMRSGFDVWNTPIPMRRFGSLTKLSLEQLKKMKSGDLLSFHNGKLIADKKNVVKLMFQSMLTSAPSSYVDCLDGKATAAKAFWNNDAADVPRPNGQISFANTHQHYVVPATQDTLIEADVDDKIIANIMEHEGMTGAQVVLWARTGTTLNQIRALDSYKPVTELSTLVGALPQYNVTGTAQAIIRGAKALGWNIKIVGTYKEAIVIETPDIPTYYILGTAYLGDNDLNAPLGWREDPAFKGLILLSPSGSNPIIGTDAQYRRYIAFGVRNRSAGACLYMHSNSTYADPTLV